VYCFVDGRPVTDLLQTGTEVMYWLEVACHEDEIAEGLEPHVAHDEEEQAFYAPDGKLVLSREYVDLRGVFGCLDAAIAEERGRGIANGRMHGDNAGRRPLQRGSYRWLRLLLRPSSG